MPVDASLLLIFIVSSIWGYTRGIINIVFPLISIAGALALCAWLAPVCTPWVLSVISFPLIALVFSYVVIFTAAHVILRKVGRITETIFKVLMLGWLNRLFGAISGFAAAVVLINTVQLFFLYLFPSQALRANTDFQQLVLMILPKVRNLAGG